MASSPRQQQLEALLVDDPHDPFLRYGLAMEYEAAGDTSGAIDQLRQLLQHSPEYVPGYLQAGQLFAKAGQTEEAKAAFQMGMQTAFKQADHHAYEEMEGMLAGLE